MYTTTRPRITRHVINGKTRREGQGQMDTEYFDVVSTILTRRYYLRDLTGLDNQSVDSCNIST